MDLNSLITGPARAGIALGRRVAGIFVGRSVSVAGGVIDRVRGGSELDDVTLARKVETEIFRSRRVAKGKVDVNVAEGVVWLRGEARTPDLIQELETKAAAIPEVKRVENLLRLPGTRARKPGTAVRRPAERRTAPVATAVGEADDTSITRRVETELFREGFAPKGKITVTTEDSVVFLRGVADSPDRIRELAAKAAAVPDVERVENLLRVEPAAEADRTSRRFGAEDGSGESPAAPFPHPTNGNGGETS